MQSVAEAMSLVDHDIQSMESELLRLGYKPSHARRVLRLFYQGAGASDFSQLSCPQSLRDLLKQWAVMRSRVIAQPMSADGSSKLLIALDGGGTVESVLMPGYRPGIAAGCVSSQIGCAMGCDFCASTRNGLERNLDAGEIVEQFLHLQRAAAAIARKLKSIVFMGMGEPMHNLDHVIAATRRIADPDMGGIGWRQVTISTVGIVPGIERLANADLNVHLALSLHAPDDPTRSKLVPSNRRYPVAEIIAAARRFQQRTGRIVTIEYCLLAEVNDSIEHAHLLAERLTGFRAHVNVIPYNAIGAGISGKIYQRPSQQRIEAFVATLRNRGVVAHVRDTRGEDVRAACGQLRHITQLGRLGHARHGRDAHATQRGTWLSNRPSE